MAMLWKRCAPIFLMLIAFTLIEGGLTADYADARSKSGGRSFSPSPSKAPASSPSYSPGAAPAGGGFGRGLAGGLLGGALGGMLFGSMFGGGGSGMGIMPLLILGGIAYFLYKKFARDRQQGGGGYEAPNQYTRQGEQPASIFDGLPGNLAKPPPAPPIIGENLLADGINQIRQTDKGFDANYFKEVASDVFFKVQAGWMHRDLDAYRHLLGEQLAKEYAESFAEMRSKGQINKLESIAVRGVEIIQAGSDGREDFVTVLFTANLLDYTVDDKSGALISGSMTDPVKFSEEWTWARPIGTQAWKLEGIKES